MCKELIVCALMKNPKSTKKNYFFEKVENIVCDDLFY